MTNPAQLLLMIRSTMVETRLSEVILKVAFRTHQKLGPGLLDTTYIVCMQHELMKLGLNVDMYKEMAVDFDGMTIRAGYEIPLLVEDKVIIDIKSENFNDLHMAQMRTYLRLSECQIGLLFNFNVETLKSGVRRVLNQPKSLETAGSARCLDLY